MIISTSRILAITGDKFPADRIESNWPLVAAALERRGISSLPCEIAAVATIAVETASFSPSKERGGPAYLRKLYFDDARRRRELGNAQPFHGPAFCARGFVPLRGRASYDHYGRLIGIDLVAEPQRALCPLVAAEVLAAFFWERKVDELAAEGKWELVRKRVNGGLAGWSDFQQYVSSLERSAAAA
jgi:hypothetical protein